MNHTKKKTKENLFFKNYDLYSDANPSDTIRIRYKTFKDVQSTIHKLETYSNEDDTILDMTCHNNYVGDRCELLNRNYMII